MGLIERAREILADDAVEFSAALDQSEASSSSSWTLRDALVTAAGCNRKAGLFAYWEHAELKIAINQVWSVLEGFTVEQHPERWANQSGRTKAEVLAVLDGGLGQGDVDVPAIVTLRPWCNPGLVRTCRIPFVPLAAFVHAWALREATITQVLKHFEIDARMNPWEFLDRIEPDIRHTDAADSVVPIAETLRSWMAMQRPEIYLPSRLFCEIAASDPALRVDGVMELAATSMARLQAAS